LVVVLVADLAVELAVVLVADWVAELVDCSVAGSVVDSDCTSHQIPMVSMWVVEWDSSAAEWGAVMVAD